ncbi:hypothetical protein K474DRAFT_1738766 [Panus rudis PR-1116 ss-1]|nr:hypothetical protein K474DRAFT_1738766 [Panus rudis PR-1116 ss-1]
MSRFYENLDARSSSSPSEASSDTIEMATLDEIAVTPDPRLHAEYRQSQYLQEDHNSDDDDSDTEDGGHTALLRPHNRTRGPERPLESDIGLWPQIKRIVIETAPTLLLTTVGLTFTGELLNSVSNWKAMARIDELIMIIPVVLNLKGNLEMNLSARLGTAANIGELDKPGARRSIILGNLSLLQVQATAVSFVAACVAFLLGRLMPRPSSENLTVALGDENTIRELPNMLVYLYARGLHQARRPRPPTVPQNDPGGLTEFIMTASSAMSAACLSSIFLGSFMCTLVVLCRKFGLDPDNVAPPVASCLGDLVTLSLLGLVSSIYINLVNTPVPFIMIILLSLGAVGWIFVTRRNPFVKDLLKDGWIPLFAAMIISSGTGIVLDTFVSRYEGFALLAVVISGLPGSAGSIFVSRLSTALHAAALSHTSLPVSTDDFAEQKHPKHNPSSKLVMITLLCVTFPVELVFLSVLRALGWLHFPLTFVLFSILFFCIAVTASLVIARYLTTFLWNRGLDPDVYAMPIHSALVDLISQLLLVACFEIVSALGMKVKSPKGG